MGELGVVLAAAAVSEMGRKLNRHDLCSRAARRRARNATERKWSTRLQPVGLHQVLRLPNLIIGHVHGNLEQAGSWAPSR